MKEETTTEQKSSPTPTKASTHSKRTFFALWFGQFVSLVGTDITKFALRIWTYQRTQSVGQYALITFFSEMPAILLSPLAGTFVDRYPRKITMVLADSSSASTYLNSFTFSQHFHSVLISLLWAVRNLAHLYKQLHSIHVQRIPVDCIYW